MVPYLKLVQDTLSEDGNSTEFLQSPSRYMKARGIDRQLLPEDSTEIRLLQSLADKNLRRKVAAGDLHGFMKELESQGIFVRRRMSGLETRLKKHLVDHYHDYEKILEDSSLSHYDMSSDQFTRGLVSKMGSDVHPNFVLNVAVLINVGVAVNVAVVAVLAVVASAAIEVEIEVEGDKDELRSKAGLLSLVDLDPEYKKQATEAATLAVALGNYEFAEHINFILFEDLAESYIDTVSDVLNPGWSDEDVIAIKSLIVRSFGRSSGIY